MANIRLALSKTAWKGVKVLTAAWLAQPVFSRERFTTVTAYRGRCLRGTN